jgi:hypothetical protein
MKFCYPQAVDNSGRGKRIKENLIPNFEFPDLRKLQSATA